MISSAVDSTSSRVTLPPLAVGGWGIAVATFPGPLDTTEKLV